MKIVKIKAGGFFMIIMVLLQTPELSAGPSGNRINNGPVARKLLTLEIIFLISTVCWQSQALPPSNHEGRDSYKGYQVLSLTPNSKEQVSLLVNMKENSNSSRECDTDWWTEPSKPGVSVDVSIAPDCVGSLRKMLKNAAIKHSVIIDDLEQIIEEEKSSMAWAESYRAGGSWNTQVYHELSEIKRFTNWLASTYPHLVSRRTLGTTYEGRKIEAFLVRQDSSIKKPVIWLDCGIHAREWVSPPVCLHAMDKLIENYNSTDPNKNLLGSYDFFILPVANPDGYAYTWARNRNRLWRKNRRPHSCGYGVDPNRNFPVNFHQGCSNPCSDKYRGTRAFSEAESKAIQKGVRIMKSEYGKRRIAAFVSIHAFSQLWMSPFGYRRDRPRDYRDHMKVMRKSVQALTSVYGTRFTYGPISEVIYIAYGSSVDWAYENSGIKYSFALELRDKGRRGFLLPASQIQPTIVETWAGLIAMARAIAPEFRARFRNPKI